jgi:hypothetical protein
MMIDDSLSAEERQDLKTFIKAIGISGAKATEICKSIGGQIYFERLADITADGVITPEERTRLNNIKGIFGLKTEIPAEGIDKRTAGMAILGKYSESLEENLSQTQKVLAFLDDAEVENPDLADLNAYLNLRSILDDFENDTEAFLADMQQFHDDLESLNASDPDDADEISDLYDQMVNAERELLEATKKYKDQNMQSQLDKVRVWRNWTRKQIEKDNNAEYVDRKAINSRAVKGKGFDPKGSPKQKSWAYDIIAEQCFTSPFWEFMENKIKNAQTDEDMIYVRFLNWLKTKPCGWWIGKFQETDLEAVFNSFKAL